MAVFSLTTLLPLVFTTFDIAAIRLSTNSGSACGSPRRRWDGMKCARPHRGMPRSLPPFMAA
jgi:hypothetical protein